MVVIDTYTIFQVQSSVGSEDRVKTNGQTDTQTDGLDRFHYLSAKAVGNNVPISRVATLPLGGHTSPKQYRQTPHGTHNVDYWALLHQTVTEP